MQTEKLEQPGPVGLKMEFSHWVHRLTRSSHRAESWGGCEEGSMEVGIRVGCGVKQVLAPCLWPFASLSEPLFVICSKGAVIVSLSQDGQDKIYAGLYSISEVGSCALHMVPWIKISAVFNIKTVRSPHSQKKTKSGPSHDVFFPKGRGTGKDANN